ncbi:hypothetical protein PLESTM_001666600 [Pleodorina starrii]|nr:hypothetical protein PLESTM_001666600 [Pleodorina starrii]
MSFRSVVMRLPHGTFWVALTIFRHLFAWIESSFRGSNYLTTCIDASMAAYLLATLFEPGSRKTGRAIRERLWTATFSWDTLAPSIARLCHVYGTALGNAPESVLYALLAIVPVLSAGMRVAPERKPSMSEALYNFVVITQPSG